MNQNISNYREKLGKAYFEIEMDLHQMGDFLQGAEDHEREISKKEAEGVSQFLKELDALLQENWTLFVGMSE